VSPEFLAPAMMIASGSIHAVVNAILKGGKDKMTGRAIIDGSSALILLPATLLVPLPRAPGAGSASAPRSIASISMPSSAHSRRATSPPPIR